MDSTTLKENFTTQLKTVAEQIAKLEEDLEKAKEYKFKLQGGLETLELIAQQEEAEAPDSAEITE
jgi:hypothetical protein